MSENTPEKINSVSRSFRCRINRYKKSWFEDQAWGYETVKLFALNYADANSFGRLNQLYDGLPFFIVKVAVTHKVFDESFRFEADGMDTISIEEKYLNLLNVTF